MTIHENPPFSGVLASQTEGTKIEAPGIFCGHALGVVVSTAATITTAVNTAAALGATQAIIFATGAMRFTLDGSTTPTASVGLPVQSGCSVTLNMADAAVAKFFGTTIDVWFTQ
jgi:hypothetical protein